MRGIGRRRIRQRVRPVTVLSDDAHGRTPSACRSPHLYGNRPKYSEKLSQSLRILRDRKSTQTPTKAQFATKRHAASGHFSRVSLLQITRRLASGARRDGESLPMPSTKWANHVLHECLEALESWPHPENRLAPEARVAQPRISHESNVMIFRTVVVDETDTR